MIKNSKLRYLIGTLLGAGAGTSLCVSVLPLALFQTQIGDEITLTYLLSRYLLPFALIWAVGGMGVARIGFPLGGGLVLGVTGLATGLFLMAMALHPAPKILAVGGITGLIYGFLGGLLLGRVLQVPPAEEPEMP
jgi:hypothetical protein